jgi:toxin secretion/phage lysis holin
MDRLLSIKNSVFICVGIVGGAVASALGGVDKVLFALLVCISADYLSGLAVAIVFRKSPKTETGGAQSKAGLVGLVKKAFILMIIAVIYQIDIVLGAGGFIRTTAIIGFMTNECLSLVENAGLMGIKLPPAVVNAIDILKKKSEDKEEK